MKSHLSVINCVQPWKNLPTFNCVSTYFATSNTGYNVQHANEVQHKIYENMKHAYTSYKMTFIEPNVY